MATLEIHEVGHRVRRVRIGRNHPIMFGTNPLCDVPLNDPSVRAFHGRIRWSKTDFKAEAVAEVPFIEVNGSQVKSKSLRQGDEIRVGPDPDLPPEHRGRRPRSRREDGGAGHPAGERPRRGVAQPHRGRRGPRRRVGLSPDGDGAAVAGVPPTTTSTSTTVLPPVRSQPTPPRPTPHRSPRSAPPAPPSMTSKTFSARTARTPSRPRDRPIRFDHGQGQRKSALAGSKRVARRPPRGPTAPGRRTGLHLAGRDRPGGDVRRPGRPELRSVPPDSSSTRRASGSRRDRELRAGRLPRGDQGVRCLPPGRARRQAGGQGAGVSRAGAGPAAHRGRRAGRGPTPTRKPRRCSATWRASPSTAT